MATMNNADMDNIGRVRNGFNTVNPDGTSTRVQGFRELIQASGAYRVSAVKAASATDQYTDALQRQKVKFTDHIKQGRLRNEVLKEQYRLQRMSAMGWTEDGNGRISADVIVPRHVPERLGSLGNTIDALKNRTGGLGDALRANAQRMGLWAQSMRSASQNLVNLGKNTQWAGRQMMMGLSLPFAALAAGTGALAYQLDKEMTRILRVYDYSVGELEGQQERIKQSTMETAKTMARTFGQAGKDTLQIAGALAAQGKTGFNLQEATGIVSRGMFLGELNQEDALKTATSILTVFRKEGETTTESNKRLADSFAYMNALENSTTLSMKDMTVAIPRLSGVVKLLGGDVQDIGTMMAATSAAGIEAAQGANALKSVLFTGAGARNDTKAGKTFFEATGQQIEDITNQTQGKAIPTLQAIGKAYKESGASAVDQLRVVRDLFGIWRGGAAELVISQLLQMEDATTNVGRAYLEGEKGAKHWAEVAQRETIALQTSASGQFKIALESVKIELAQMGVPFLKVATQILGMVGSLMKSFNGLSDGQKKWLLIAAAAIAIIGPLTMILGVIGTLIGTLVRAGTGLLLFVSQFKLLSREQRIAALTAGQARLTFINESVAANTLAASIGSVTASIATLNAANTAMALRNGANVAAAAVGPRMGPVLPPVTTRTTKSGQDRHFIAGHDGKEKRISNAQAATFARSAKMEEQEKSRAQTAGIVARHREREAAAAEKTAKAGTRIAGTGMATAGMMGMMVAGGNQWVLALSVALMLFGSLNIAGKAMIVKQSIMLALEKAKLAFMNAAIRTQYRLTAVTAGAAAGSKAFLGSLLGAINPVGLVVAGVIAAGAAMWHLDKRAKKAVETYEKLADVAKGAADILGLAFNDSTTPIDPSNKVQKQLTLVAQLNEKYKEQIGLISKMNEEEAAREIRRIGLEFFMGTGDAEQAQAVMDALASSAKGQTAAATMDIKVNFTQDNVVDNLVGDLESRVGKITSREYGTSWRGRTFGGSLEGDAWYQESQFGISEKAAAEGRRAGEELATAMNAELTSADIKGADELMAKAQNLFKEKAKGILEGIDFDLSDDEKVKFEEMFDFKPENMDKFADLILSSGGMKELRDNFGIEFDDKEMNDFVIGYRNYLVAAGKGAGLTKEAAAKLDSLNAIVQESPGYAAAAAAAAGQVANGNKKMATTADVASGAIDGQAMALEGLSDAQKKVLDTRKQAMGEAWGNVLDEIADSVDERHDAAIDNMEAASDKRLAAIDAEEKKREKEFDDRSEKQDKRHQTEERGFTSSWETRTKTVTKSYDDRAKAIEDTMERERKADEQRQKMFEAEKQRIQRLSELYNQNVDFNVALNSGDMDEAAKLANNMQANQSQWALDDASAASGDAGAVTQEKRQAEIDGINTAKEKRLEQLKIEEDAAKLALQERQTREKQALEDEKARYKEGVEARRATEEQKTKIATDAANKAYQERKKYLDLELAAYRAMTPANLAEMQTYLGEIQTRYGQHGIKLDTSSKQWGDYVARAIRSSSETAQKTLQDEAKWNDIGASIGADLAQGMLGMTFPQFLTWMQTGELPAEPATKSKAQIEYDERRAAGTAPTSSNPRFSGRHSGGPIGTSDSSRAGRPLSAGLYADEVPIIAQKGEFMMQRSAVDRIGMDNLHAMNQGAKVPDHTGRMHRGGLVGGIAAMVTSAMQTGLTAGMARGAQRKAAELQAEGRYSQIPPQLLSNMYSGATAGEAGKYGGATFDVSQLQNAATIVGVGRQMGASERDLIIGLMTAMQESGLRNINYGDRDSVGLFQQRTSQGWGTIEQIMNPSYAATKFFEGLLKVENRNSMGLSAAAQAVQRSQYPDAYAKWEDEARAILAGGVSAGVPLPVGTLPPGVAAMAPTGEDGFASHLTSLQRQIQPSVLQRVWQGLAMVPGRQLITSGLRPGSIVAGSNGRLSAHSSGRAADIGALARRDGGTAESEAMGDKIAAVFRSGVIPGVSQVLWKTMQGGNHYDHVHVGFRHSGGEIGSSMTKGLKDGGYTLNDGYAKLHKNEAVLTAPLTAQLERGIGNLDAGANTTYDITMDFRGAVIREDVDIERAVAKVLQAQESKMGRKRTIK